MAKTGESQHHTKEKRLSLQNEIFKARQSSSHTILPSDEEPLLDSSFNISASARESLDYDSLTDVIVIIYLISFLK